MRDVLILKCAPDGKCTLQRRGHEAIDFQTKSEALASIYLKRENEGTRLVICDVNGNIETQGIIDL